MKEGLANVDGVLSSQPRRCETAFLRPIRGLLERMQELKEMLRAYLIALQEELRVTNPELAAFVAVHTVEALTHAALLYHPARVRDGTLAREITDLLVRYLVLPSSGDVHIDLPLF